ncbi:MAG: hypothetical protein Q4G48_05880 [Bacteroidia bacterium]|nr:hypothetical protein [Bacteroidia bacterium]
MRNRLILFCLFSFVFISIDAKETDSIFFILPDSVELKISEEIKNIDFSEFGLFFSLSTFDKNIYRINYSCFSNVSKPKDPWVDNTNRFLIINDNKFPLIFDYDSDFSTQKNSISGKNQKVYIIFDGYSITFRSDGTIISEKHGILQKAN